jgi:23S rRNA (adenine-C8)-methyltransferase
MLLDDVTAYLEELHEPSFRIKQIRTAIYGQYVRNFTDITTLSLSLREALQAKFTAINPLKVLRTISGEQAEKVLFETPSGHLIEAVKLTYLPNRERTAAHTALCLSTQSGCAMGCQFCATGAIGFKQNLSADEITGQYLYFKQKGDPIDSLIFMGMGEPFANEANLFEALHTLTDPDLFALSPSRLSISTVGLIPGIRRLTAEYPQVNLTYSLHTPFDTQRAEIMPVNQTYPLKDVFTALNEYIKTTKNRVFLAYTLLKDVNDSPEHAAALAELIRAQKDTAYLYHVNLIRYNPCPSEVIFERAEPAKVKEFQATLDRLGIKNTLRQDFGVEIDAACGQLYASYSRKKPLA